MPLERFLQIRDCLIPFSFTCGRLHHKLIEMPLLHLGLALFILLNLSYHRSFHFIGLVTQSLYKADRLLTQVSSIIGVEIFHRTGLSQIGFTLAYG